MVATAQREPGLHIHVSSEIAAINETAARLSIQQNQYFVGVEHLFAALVDEPDRLPPAFRERYLDSLYAVQRELIKHAWRGQIPSDTGEVFHTPRAIALTSTAAKIAQKLRHANAGGGHLMLAMLAQEQSAPARAMETLGLDRKQCVEQLRQILATGQVEGRAPAPQAMEAAAPAADDAAGVAPVAEELGTYLPFDDAPSPRSEKPKAELQLTRDLNAAARDGKLQPVIGRAQEVVQVMQILTRKTKNNAMLVGEAGVGKTQLVEGLALQLFQGTLGASVPPFRIYELNLSSLMAGTAYRGAFEEKVSQLIDRLKRDPNAVLFIDEVHLIMGAGSTDGDGMDLANLLKPVLARGEIRCIGATTLQEYRKFVEKDPAIERRFQMVRLEALSAKETMEVLERIKPSLEKHHKVHISESALEAAVSLTERYMPNRNFPDKAIDVLDQACARQRLNINSGTGTIGPGGSERVTRHGLLKVVSQITGIPLEEMTAEERRNIRELDKRLRDRVIGQDEAVGRVVAAVKKSRAGLADPNRPDSVLLFLGPSGVGKTQLAKSLARELFGSSDHLITFDMGEYIEEHSVSRLLGAPPGYVGSEEDGRLTGAVRNNPFSILLFDEIEKAHPRIFDIFLPIFDEGRLKDSRDRVVSFRNTIIILTSNIGADYIAESDGGVDNDKLLAELRKHFRPELINRIDEIVPFYPLLKEDVRSILRLEINKLRYRLRSRHIKIHMYQGAYDYLGEVGYDRQYGARELRRAVDRYVTGPISDMLIEERFADGDIIDVKMEENRLVFTKGESRRQTSEIL
ncbi:MAG: AAA domain-containing protein [Candidatus Hydrogenedens sp.]|nr:AAA domain-containing protein [Candidatus Hydrogenedens sp.]